MRSVIRAERGSGYLTSPRSTSFGGHRRTRRTDIEPVTGALWETSLVVRAATTHGAPCRDLTHQPATDICPQSVCALRSRNLGQARSSLTDLNPVIRDLGAIIQVSETEYPTASRCPRMSENGMETVINRAKLCNVGKPEGERTRARNALKSKRFQRERREVRAGLSIRWLRVRVPSSSLNFLGVFAGTPLLVPRVYENPVRECPQGGFSHHSLGT